MQGAGQSECSVVVGGLARGENSAWRRGTWASLSLSRLTPA
jgi:hypothetical protein